MYGNNALRDAFMLMPGRLSEIDTPAVPDNFFAAQAVTMQGNKMYEHFRKRYPDRLIPSPSQDPILVTGILPYKGASEFYNLVSVPDRFK